MLSRVSRRIVQFKPLYLRNISIVCHAKRFESSMYCMQCEQTSHGTGCRWQGICGKWPETANMQDLLLYVNNGLAQYIHTMGEDKLDESLKQETRQHIIDSVCSTITNVNFSEHRTIEYIKKTIDIREAIKPKFRSLYPEKTEFEIIENNPCNYNIGDIDILNEDAMHLASLEATKSNIGDANCWGLRECAEYGLKGSMAYFGRAQVMNESDRDDIFKFFYGTMNGLCSVNKDLYFWLAMNMEIGAKNIRVLELLDKSNNSLYGVPEVTSVSSTPIVGKCILISGHDIFEVKKVLDLIEKTKLDINVYTHCELLPAHSYPELKKYSNFVGHFGSAWHDQYKDFKAFPGPIIMTSNCLIPPRGQYRDRLYTIGCVGYDDLKHIDTNNEKELQMVLNKAMQCDGFDNQSILKWKEAKPYLCGFGHATILSQADIVLNAIKSGDLQHIFVIGGCDGTEETRSYFTDLANITPNNSIILTLGCGKFKLHELELGDIGGIPRILDCGQCNDAYSAVVVALKLAEALETDVHHLPLHFAISWFSQDAISILLSLLHLGIKNIRLGPALPAFLTDDVRKYLFDNLGVRQVTLSNPKQDLKEMLAETPIL